MRSRLSDLAKVLDQLSDLLFIIYLVAVIFVVIHYHNKFCIPKKSRIQSKPSTNGPSIDRMEQQQEFKLGGLNMNFPYVPYGIQKAMLAKIAVTLTNKEHSLIESPTGTGKTLVLLCASLAWQRESKANHSPMISTRLKTRLIQDRLSKLKNRPCSCGRRPNRTELDELKEAKGDKKSHKGYVDGNDDLKESALKKMKTVGDEDGASPYFKNNYSDPLKQNITKNREPEFILIESDDEEPKVKVSKLETVVEDVIDISEDSDVLKKPSVNENSKKSFDGDDIVISQDLCKNCQAIQVEDVYMEEMGDATTKFKISKVPRIYYGTRTHKQITQVIRELNKTKYREDLKMCILSSRDRTCINDDVRDAPDRNDRCQELVKNKSKSSSTRKKVDAPETCPYYKDSNSMTVEFEAIHEEFKQNAWDIEDALVFARKSCICPYYGVRSIQEQADITFCPYNYLLDPNIRKALNINLSNAVIIFDEAHNIEDICRDSASFIINTTQTDEILSSINRASQSYMQGSTVFDAYVFFRNLFTDMKAFLIRYQYDDKDNIKDGDCLARHIMVSQEMIQSLEQLSLGPKHLQAIKEHLRSLRGEDDDSSEKPKGDDSQDAMLNSNEMQFITQLTNCLDFMYGQTGKYCADYRLIVSKHLERLKPGHFRTANRSVEEPQHVQQLSLMCMNPGIAFEKIHSLAWSVIVASGTLSPIESLKTELGCNFAQVFEGSHVIGNERIFAAILSRGPNSIDLNCAYQNSLRLEFQDEVGMIIRDVCRKVPNGVLCFFPSYDRMENLYQRWFTKGYMKDIEKSGKKLFREQKSFTAAKFEEELSKYHKNAKNKGALLFAVFRGKVSEGIDFSDTAARAVITIGIPYPNVREITVNLKREYNDTARKVKPHLMTGSDWYSSQAFRALNQALGRCIRHRADWGAILMIDSRLRQGSSINNISKWIRKALLPTNDYSQLSDSLEQFVQVRSTND